MNVRIPERAMGDLRAQVAAVRTGEKRFLELVSKLRPRRGARRASRRSWTTARRRRARSVRAIPDGVYEAESFMDDDGVDTGKRIPMRVKVTVGGDEMTIDLTGVSDAGARLLQLRRHGRPLLRAGRVQVPHHRRSTCRSTTAASARSKIVLPPGKVVSARSPRRCAGG